MDASVPCCSSPLMGVREGVRGKGEGGGLYVTQTRRRFVSLSQDRPWKILSEVDRPLEGQGAGGGESFLWWERWWWGGLSRRLSTPESNIPQVGGATQVT